MTLYCRSSTQERVWLPHPGHEASVRGGYHDDTEGSGRRRSGVEFAVVNREIRTIPKAVSHIQRLRLLMIDANSHSHSERGFSVRRWRASVLHGAHNRGNWKEVYARRNGTAATLNALQRTYYG